LLALAMPVLGGWNSCQKSIDSDPSFDLWCGGALCDWQTDAGEVKRVPTWHPDDSGVELVGPNAQISQLVTLQGTQTPQCLEFEMVSDIAADAAVTLLLDFADDGAPEFSAPVPATSWQAVRFSVTPPTWFGKVRFILRKAGAGRAVLAQLRITEGSGCAQPALPLSSRPDAAPCASDAECASGRCGASVFPYIASSPDIKNACGECKAQSDCAAGQVCGVAISDLGMHAACTATRAKLGERCLENRDCAAGVCCGEVCSTCCFGLGCSDPASCVQVPDPTAGKALWVSRPWMCSPGQGAAASGAACLSGADCKSGSCDGSGPLAVCWFDGRRCKTDADCPAAGQDPKGVQPACVTLGEDDGRCR
jgi:hypothetical protein